MSVIPFGKYKGQQIAELPESYMRWLLEQDFVDGKIKQEIRALLNIWREADVVEDDPNMYEIPW